MRVLICGEALQLGGAETVSIDLANALARRGVEVAYSAAPGPLEARLAAGVRIERTPPLERKGWLRFLRGFFAVLRGFEPDVVHVQGATLALAARLLSRIVRKRFAVVLTHHSTSYRRAPPRLSGPLLRASCDHMIAISRLKQRQFLAMGFDAASVSLIPNFVDCRAIREAADHADRARLRSELGIADSERVVAMVGRMIPGKGFDVFLRSVARCAQQLERPLVALALGDGPERESLERLADSLAGPVRAVLPGYRRDVTALLSLCDAVLFPSTLTEVLPMTLIEASAVGVPIVCSDIPGNREVVQDGANGLLAGPSDESYAEALARVLGDAVLAQRMASAGQQAALAKFDESVVVPKIISLYSTLV